MSAVPLLRDGADERGHGPEDRDGLVAPAHFPFSRTSSSGAGHGYGSISMRPGSATRGPIPLAQMNSWSGPNRTRS